eukprot:6783762-Prymnesium_polylepis.1
MVVLLEEHHEVGLDGLGAVEERLGAHVHHPHLRMLDPVPPQQPRARGRGHRDGILVLARPSKLLHHEALRVLAVDAVRLLERGRLDRVPRRVHLQRVDPRLARGQRLGRVVRVLRRVRQLLEGPVVLRDPLLLLLHRAVAQDELVHARKLRLQLRHPAGPSAACSRKRNPRGSAARGGGRSLVSECVQSRIGAFVGESCIGACVGAERRERGAAARAGRRILTPSIAL